MRLVISNGSGMPIYEQIKAQIKEAILSGELEEEEALPSLRTLARELKISVLTTTRAYTELEQEGFVKNVQGKGAGFRARKRTACPGSREKPYGGAECRGARRNDR